MLFSEIYGSYFHAVSDILREASAGGLTGKRLTELVRETAFAESTLSIPAALKDGSWPLLDRDLKPVLRHAPSMPLATLQKRWLKALLLDRRIALFAPSAAGLEDVEPLYRPEVFVLFDQYADGDPYEDETYIKCFQMILQAIREKRVLRVRFHDHTGRPHAISCVPYRLGYSARSATGWNGSFCTSPTLKRRRAALTAASIRSGSAMTGPTKPNCSSASSPSGQSWRSAHRRRLWTWSGSVLSGRRENFTKAGAENLLGCTKIFLILGHPFSFSHFSCTIHLHVPGDGFVPSNILSRRRNLWTSSSRSLNAAVRSGQRS